MVEILFGAAEQRSSGKGSVISRTSGCQPRTFVLVKSSIISFPETNICLNENANPQDFVPFLRSIVTFHSFADVVVVI